MDNLSVIDGFATAVPVLACDGDTARYYGEIKAGLRARGRPIPENDIWIAAISRQHNLTLVSRDTHFGEVNNLIVETW